VTKKVSITDLVVPIIAAAFGFLVMGYASMQSSITGSNFFRLNAIAWFNPGYSDDGSFSGVLNSIGNSRLRRVFQRSGKDFSTWAQS